MSTAVIIIIFIVALILSVGFLLLVFTLIPAINQLKYFLIDLEKTSTEFRGLSIKLKEVADKVDHDVEKVDSILDNSQEAMKNISSTLKFFNKNVFKQSAGLFALIPAIKLGWKLVKKHKGGK